MQLSTLSAHLPCSNASQQKVLLHRITSGKVWSVAPDVKGGLLLVKPFYVDFAGAGAAVGGEFDADCVAVFMVGEVRLQPVLSQRDRKAMIHTRKTYTNQLCMILDVPHPAQRGHLVLAQLATWLPGNLSLTIPAELIAGLAGVLPRTIQRVWQAPKVLANDVTERQSAEIPA
jgi:hypothetical protein